MWTVDAARPKAYGDAAIAGLGLPVDPDEPWVVTQPDSARRPCAEGRSTDLGITGLTLCPDGADGGLSASVDLEDPAGGATAGHALVTLSQWRSMPGPTDVRLDVSVEVPLPADPTPQALRGSLGEAVETGRPRLDAMVVQQVDLISPRWTDYGFALTPEAWDAQPAPVVE